jgi:hypothetical protein
MIHLYSKNLLTLSIEMNMCGKNIFCLSIDRLDMVFQLHGNLLNDLTVKVGDLLYCSKLVKGRLVFWCNFRSIINTCLRGEILGFLWQRLMGTLFCYVPPVW